MQDLLLNYFFFHFPMFFIFILLFLQEAAPVAEEPAPVVEEPKKVSFDIFEKLFKIIKVNFFLILNIHHKNCF